MKKAEELIVKAKVKMQKENPFFAYLVMNLKIKEDKDCETMGVDSYGNCGYNPKWIEKLSEEEIKTLLSHEVLHLALEHLIRGNGKDHLIYNVACDIVINGMLLKSNFSFGKGLSDGCVPFNNEIEVGGINIDEIDKKSAEEVYHILFKKAKKIKELCGSGGIKGFDKHKHNDKGGGSKVERENKKKWNRVFSEASHYAKQQGNVPEGMQRVLDDILDEKVNWKYLLYKYITRTLPYDYTYNRPSKRSISTGFYMPSVLRENIQIVVSIDTSGSIDQKELDEFLSEIIGIAKSFNNVEMKLIVCDCEIKDVYRIANGDIAKIKSLKIRGGGGTDHRPIYDYINENLPNTRFVINFTDGYTSFPDTEETKTIWVLTKNSCKEEDIPFGEVIKLE